VILRLMVGICALPMALVVGAVVAVQIVMKWAIRGRAPRSRAAYWPRTNATGEHERIMLDVTRLMAETAWARKQRAN